MSELVDQVEFMGTVETLAAERLSEPLNGTSAPRGASQTGRASRGPSNTVSDTLAAARRATTPDELPDGPERTVFTHSQTTRKVWQAARSRLGSPWAVLGCVIARTVAAAGPHVQLPPLVGGHMSLNLLVGLVGDPGSGKGTAEAIAHGLFTVEDDQGRDVEVPELPLGSGEGIAELFTRRGNPGDDEPVSPTPDRVLFRVPEIDSLSASSARRESTILPTLRQAFMGEPLGHTGATSATTRNVEAHSYRLCVVMGIQPRRSDGLLRDADGGTPQRVLWLPVSDPGAPDSPPGDPGVTTIRLPVGARSHNGVAQMVMTLPSEVEALVRSNRLRRLRGEAVVGLDGHLLLTREKVAAALALMDGRADVSAADWSAAGAMIDLSTSTREMCREACQGAAVEATVSKRITDAAAEDEAADAVEAQRTSTVRDKVLRLLADADGIPLPFRKVSRSMSGKRGRDGASQRARLPGVLEDLVGAGLILESETLDGKDQPTTEYALARG